MKTGDIVYKNGKRIMVTKKGYSSIGNKIVWYGVDDDDAEHKLTGNEMSKEEWDKSQQPDTKKLLNETLRNIQTIKGDKPKHKWDKTSLSFENPDGEFDSGIDLKGDKGDNPLVVSNTIPTNPKLGDLWFKP